jgi:hypothetical protein
MWYNKPEGVVLWVGVLVACGLWRPAIGAERHPANVPPAQEIEVLDPNADALGNPTVELQRGPQGELLVDIPRTVLVHKFYYTGDRSFQAQMLPGGPSIVVADHPKTGERCYIDVQMLPGAPRVTYTSREIQYDFGHDAIIVCFGLRGKPKIVYRHGVPLRVKAARGVKSLGQCTTNLLAESGVCEHAGNAARSAKNAIGNVAHTTHDLAGMAVTPIANVAMMTPIGSIFQPNPERKRDAAVTRAQAEKARADASIRTLR